MSNITSVIDFNKRMGAFRMDIGPRRLVGCNVATLRLCGTVTGDGVGINNSIVAGDSRTCMMHNVNLVGSLRRLQGVTMGGVGDAPILMHRLTSMRRSSLPHLKRMKEVSRSSMMRNVIMVHGKRGPKRIVGTLGAGVRSVGGGMLPGSMRVMPFCSHRSLMGLTMQAIARGLVRKVLLIAFVMLVFVTS